MDKKDSIISSVTTIGLLTGLIRKARKDHGTVPLITTNRVSINGTMSIPVLGEDRVITIHLNNNNVKYVTR